MRRRKREEVIETRHQLRLWDRVRRGPVYCPSGDRRRSGVSLIQAFMRNMGTWRPDAILGGGGHQDDTRETFDHFQEGIRIRSPEANMDDSRVVQVEINKLAGFDDGPKVAMDRDVPTVVRPPMQEIGFERKHESYPWIPSSTCLKIEAKSISPNSDRRINSVTPHSASLSAHRYTGISPVAIKDLMAV